MIVNDDTVSKALQYLAEDPHPIALAKKDVTDTENEAKAAYARGFLDSGGTNADARKADAELSQDYMNAKVKESHASLAFERHRARVKAAEMIIEVWRSEQANVRAAERVR